MGVIGSDTLLCCADLQPGDVLLSRGSARLGSRISDWICLLDGGIYSHASLWDGESVLESCGSAGLSRASRLGLLVREHEYVHVYRPARDPALSPEPVVSVAQSLLGSTYPYGELLLFGVLVGLGRLSGSPTLEEMLRRIGPALWEALAELRRQPVARRPMTCSGFVAHAFWDADPGPTRRYALRVAYEPGKIARSGPSSRESSDPLALDELIAECQKLVRELTPEPPRAQYRSYARGIRGVRALGARAKEVIAGSFSLPCACVTPRDLQLSASMTCMGSLRA